MDYIDDHGLGLCISTMPSSEYAGYLQSLLESPQVFSGA